MKVELHISSGNVWRTKEGEESAMELIKKMGYVIQGQTPRSPGAFHINLSLAGSEIVEEELLRAAQKTKSSVFEVKNALRQEGVSNMRFSC